jgi:hypothetical protein
LIALLLAIGKQINPDYILVTENSIQQRSCSQGENQNQRAWKNPDF